MFIAHIRDLLAPDMDEVIRARLDSNVALVSQVAEYIIGSGGKRLRPLLVLLSAGAFSYHGRDHYQLAAVVEFVHTATLLHDDVVDTSALRRGKPTANALFGNAASVLVGDFVYSRAFQMMVEVDNMRVMKVLAEATNMIAEGEVLQLMNCQNPDIDERSYLQVIRYKTAKLFEAATRLGAILGGATSDQEAAMATYGMHLGTAFQLIDDVLDYSGDHMTMGKNVGDDLSEGKATLPLIFAIKQGSNDEAALIRKAIKEGGLDELGEVLSAISRTGALDYTRRQAETEVLSAKQALSGLSDTQYREYLMKLADFAVSRDH
jgi:octaprenyl-diphosphate synthase